MRDECVSDSLVDTNRKDSVEDNMRDLCVSIGVTIVFLIRSGDEVEWRCWLQE